jgi:hypothetical protein
MAVGNRLGKVEGRVGPRLCAEGAAPCQTVTTTELRIMPFGAEERSGTPPPPLCEACPDREGHRLRIRHILVVLDYRNRFDGGPEKHGRGIASADVSGSYPGPETAPDAPTAPEPDGLVLPAAFGPGHPARLIAEGREPEPPRRAKPPGRSDETTRISPSDFGLTT